MKHDERVTSAQFSPDGELILTASEFRPARVWDARSGKLVSEVKEGKDLGDKADTAQFSADGKRILTTSRSDKTARVWDAVTGKAYASGKGQIQQTTAQLWDSADGKSVSTLKISGTVLPRFSPDGKRIVTDSISLAAKIWDAQTGKALTDPMMHDAQIRSAEFRPDGRQVITMSGKVRVWDAQTGAPLTGIEPETKSEEVRVAHFSPDGKRVVTAAGRQARVSDAQTGKPLTKSMKCDPPGGHDMYYAVSSVEFSPDGKSIVTASGSPFMTVGEARVWNAETGEPVTEPITHAGWVISVCFSHDGKWILTASSDKTARVWDAMTGKALAEPMRHSATVVSARFSHDDKRIVTRSADRTARIWDAQSGSPLSEPIRYDGGNTCDAEFSPDGKWILTVWNDKSARVWETLAFGKSLPGWLAEVADAMAGQHLNDSGLFEPLSRDSSETLKQIKDRLNRESSDNDWVVWGRWFLADRSTRTISPFSKVPTPEYIENRIKRDTLQSLDEVEPLTVGNEELSNHIARTRESPRLKAEQEQQKKEEEEYQQRRAKQVEYLKQTKKDLESYNIKKSGRSYSKALPHER
jgi:WD40 repeat protein/adenylate kinase family enzyme